VPRLELRPFSDEFVPDAGRLLAERHGRHRVAEPLLPARYGDAGAAADEIEALWTTNGTSGAVALRDGRATGYLLGACRDEETWGANIWIGPSGHAVEQAEDARDLYGAAAGRWVEEGRTRHYAVVPATDAPLVDAWFRSGFGQQHALGIRELPDDVELPTGVREAVEHDVDALVELSPLLAQHQTGSPVFGPAPVAEDEGELRRELLADIADPDVAELVYERDGRLLGGVVVVPVELSPSHVGPARPEGVPLLTWAATRPDVRGSGVGLALTHAAFAWARSRGREAMVVDWRVTNLLASRFWPARGFRTTFLRLYRSIP
jgi:GNAT superfamily N-acetyltransferase